MTIDFGTTYSAIGVTRPDGTVENVRRADGQVLVPSVVSFNNVKRQLGTGRLLSVGNQSLTPELVASLVIRSLRDDATAATGVTVRRAVVACPANFSRHQRAALRQAFELAGLEVLRIVGEPNSAGMLPLSENGDELRYLVVDLGGGGCIDCGGKAPVDPDVAVADMLAADLKPLEPYATALTRWRCRCLKCGNVVEVRLAGVRNGNAGCLHCGRAGFALRGPAILYLITHRGHRAHKIGIMGRNAVRLDRHNQQGWATFGTFSFAHYVDAYRVEQGVLRLLRQEMGISSYLPSEDVSNGWTETIDARRITLAALRGLVGEETTRIIDERRRFRRQRSSLTNRRSGPRRTDGFEMVGVPRPPLTSWTHRKTESTSRSGNVGTGSYCSRRTPTCLHLYVVVVT
ncbi:Hsp70 family protein [Actinophytocola sp.]|uniref:Hsp70 family protein n=1 Tax=Actinophytocola sp. TaxID=1872138 RepID=UPI00389A4139